MKKFITILIVLIALAVSLRAQQLQQYKYGLYDDYFLNPAYVGTPNYYTMMVGHDIKFAGIPVSPSTSFIGLHSRVGQGYLFAKDGKVNKFFSKFGNSAFGFQGLIYNFGSQYEYNFGLTYGYHLDLSPNTNTKLPRKLILAFTPRLTMMNFDRNKFYYSNGDPIISIDDQLIGGIDDDYFHMNFKFDVGALFQSVYYDLGISWLNFTNTHNVYDSDELAYGTTGYSIYDSVYSSLIALNGKLKFIRLLDDSKFNINFIPDFNFMFKPNSSDFEIKTDLRFDFNFYNIITASRKELRYNVQSGANFVYTHFYGNNFNIQPYILFDFLNFKLQYTYIVRIPNKMAGWGGNQITFIYALGRDNVLRVSDKSRMPRKKQ
jgi:hypothetical protein